MWRFWIVVGLICAMAQVAFANTFDIVVIGNGYPATGTQLQEEAASWKDHLLTYEPFRSRAHQLTIRAVPGEFNFNCRYSGRLILCDTFAVKTKLNELGVPFDQVLVFVNNGTYGGSGGPVAVSYNGTYRNEVATHELAHGLWLIDEYLLLSVDQWISNTPARNCWASVPPPEWSPTPFKECNSPNWYRSTQDSLMRTITSRYFNPVSQKVMNDRLDAFTGAPTVDATPPTVKFQQPLAGATVSGKVDIVVSAQDAGGISKIDLYTKSHSNGYSKLRATSTSSPLRWRWNVWSKSYPKGAYTLRAEAFDVAGNKGVTEIQVNK